MLFDGAGLLADTSREPQRDAAYLLGHVLQRDRTWLLAHPEASVTTAERESYHALLARRARHEPMQYILGEQEFYGLRFAVTPAVLIPRPETEHLVEAVLERLPHNRAIRIVDVGTGSGAIAVTLAHLLPLALVDAVDISPAALAVAKQNAQAQGVAARVRFYQTDLLEGLQGERYDAVVSNPPYVSPGEQLEPQVLEWEPHEALFAGEHGLAVYRRLIPAARAALRDGGLLAMELGAGQAPAVAALLAEHETLRDENPAHTDRENMSWGEPVFVRDLQGIERVMLTSLHGRAAAADDS